MSKLAEVLEYVALRLEMEARQVKVDEEGDKHWLYNAEDGTRIGTLENKEDGYNFYNANNELVLENIEANL